MENWRSISVTSQSRISYILNNDLFSDVQFTVGPDAVTYSAHRLLLMLASPVFGEKFINLEDRAKLKIRIEDVSSDSFYKMLKFIYTDEIELNALKEAYDILATAQKFKIEHLEARCQKYIYEREVTPEIACKTYEIALDLKMPKVAELCKTAFASHSQLVLKSPGFIEAKFSTVEEIVKCEELDVPSELVVIEAVMNWGHMECKRSGYIPSNDSIRSCIAPLIKYLRFLSLSFDEFQDFLKTNDILSAHEASTIAIKILQPDRALEMPDNLCTMKSERQRIFGAMLNCSDFAACSKSDDDYSQKAAGNTKFEKKDICNELARNMELEKKYDCQELLFNNELSSKMNNVEDFEQSPKQNNVAIPISNAVFTPNIAANNTTDDLSSDTSDSETEELEKVVLDENLDYKACTIELDFNTLIPNALKITDVHTVVDIEMERGKIRIVGVFVAVKNLSTSQNAPVSIFVRLSSNGNSIEQTHDVLESQNVLFQEDFVLTENEHARIKVEAENLQLRKCGLASLEVIKLKDRDIAFSVKTSGNLSPRDGQIPCLISRIIYVRF